MNISQIGKSLEVYQAQALSSSTQKSTELQKSDAVKSRDYLTLSNVAKDYQTALNAVKEAPEVRKEKVSELRAALATNNYNVSAEEVSSKIVDNYFSTLI